MIVPHENKDKIFRVYALAFSNDFDKVYLVKKRRPSKQKQLMNAMGGVSDWYKEDAIQGMTREFDQEAGLFIDPKNWTEVECKDKANSNLLFYTTRLETWMIPSSAIGQHVWSMYWKNYTQRTWQDIGAVADIFYLINKAHHLLHDAVSQ